MDTCELQKKTKNKHKMNNASPNHGGEGFRNNFDSDQYICPPFFCFTNDSISLFLAIYGSRVRLRTKKRTKEKIMGIKRGK